jgi:hypothetical protein
LDQFKKIIGEDGRLYETMPENPRLLSLGMNGITERSQFWLAKRRLSQA